MRQETLPEACAPVLAHLATFRRNAATTGLTIQAVHSALRVELDRVRAHCERDPRLAPLIERSFYALVATADQVVLTSAWPQRTAWSMHFLLESTYFRQANGGSQFFRFVEEIKHEPTEAASEIAALLFHCMALGFQGELIGERRELEKRRQELFDKARLGDVGAAADGNERHLAPDAYGKNSTLQSAKLPTVNALRLVAVALVALVAAWSFGAITTSLDSSADREQLDEINGVMQTDTSDREGVR